MSTAQTAAARTTHWLGPVGSFLALIAPKGLCPICVAASGGVLSSLGLTFLADGKIMRWILAAALALGLLGLGLGARTHRRWWVFGLGLIGAVTLYTGWFIDMRPVLYAGMAVLMAASIANLRRRRAEPLVQLRLRKETDDG